MQQKEIKIELNGTEKHNRRFLEKQAQKLGRRKDLDVDAIVLEMKAASTYKGSIRVFKKHFKEWVALTDNSQST